MFMFARLCKFRFGASWSSRAKHALDCRVQQGAQTLNFKRAKHTHTHTHTYDVYFDDLEQRHGLLCEAKPWGAPGASEMN